VVVVVVVVLHSSKGANQIDRSRLLAQAQSKVSTSTNEKRSMTSLGRLSKRFT